MHGQCNGAFDYYEVKIADASHYVHGWIAHSNQACKVYDATGNEVLPTMGAYPADTLKRIRCFNKGDNLIEINLDISPNPSNDTRSR